MSVSDVNDDINIHVLRANPNTVHWGYFDNSVEPALTINSGDVVFVEAITHAAGDAPDLMMDDAIKEIYDAIPVEARNPGAHIMTGPIYVKDAHPGDMIEVEILEITPRIPYGSNLTANWGYLYEEFNQMERVTIYEFDKNGNWLTAKFAYDFPGSYNVNGPIVEPGSAERFPVLSGVQIPVRLHIGNMAVAPAESGKISSTPPGPFGGNIDNWRIGAGSSMYYPVFNEGALLSLGDTHFAQGDSELSGTAIEGSANCLIRVNVRKDMNFSSPILETATSWIVHAFDADLNKAMRKASLELVNFLEKFYQLSREEAYSFISVAADFSVTQVVDQERGIHVSIPKNSIMPR